jgi:hypothetical protein
VNIGNVVGNAIGILILLAWLIFHVRAFPQFVSELSFYSRNGWDFRKDSGKKVFAQDKMIVRFGYFPLGIVKILVLVIQMILFAMPLIAAFNGYFARTNMINQNYGDSAFS